MREFKVNEKQLLTDLTALKTAGNNINTSGKNVSGNGVDSLPTSMKYIEEQRQIGDLLELYQQLLSKDIRDIESMHKTVIRMDSMLLQKK